MSAQIIDGKAIAKQIREEIRTEIESLQKSGITPGLGVILVGDDPGSSVYVSKKEKTAKDLGLHSVTLKFPATLSHEELLEKIHQLNQDPNIHGILVQLPLPKQIDTNIVIESIDPEKDVDGFHPKNVGALMTGEPVFVPCTPAGIMTILQRSNIDPAGKHAVVLGRSNIVGKPMVNLLMQKRKGANATVTVCHTGTKNIVEFTKQADILIVAMGKAKTVSGDMIKPGVVIIDVGVNRVEDRTKKSGYRLIGDVDFESASQIASHITPVPGGVGPMTIVMLMKNTLLAASRLAKR